MKTIIAGSRGFNDYNLLKETVESVYWNITQVISGTARGADKLGEQWAIENGIEIVQFPADWDTYGKSAGPIRNHQMAKHAEACIIFWDGKSRGTANMISLAKKYNLHIKVVIYKEIVNATSV